MVQMTDTFHCEKEQKEVRYSGCYYLRPTQCEHYRSCAIRPLRENVQTPKKAEDTNPPKEKEDKREGAD